MSDDIFPKINTVLILGNGFDKSCGLKTGYQDLYDEYLVSTSPSKLVSDFKKTISKEFNKWSDFELGMAMYAQSFDSEDDFLYCLDDFNGYMHGYLNRIQTEFHEKWNKLENPMRTIDEFKKSVNSLGYGVTHNLDDMLRNRNTSNIAKIGFISLNYTDVFDVLLDKSFDKQLHQTPIHVHGVLGDDPVLGMDREEQLNLRFNVSTRFKRHFIKPFFNTVFDSARIEKSEKLIKSASTVFVYGASLGDSDLSWRELLINWLHSNENNHLFVYFYRNAVKSFKTVSERLDYEEEQQIEVLKDWGIKNGEIPMNQFHLPCSIKLFNIEASLNEDEKRQEEIDTVRAKISRV